MKIINAVLSRKRGGVERAAVDYTQALTMAGHEVHVLLESRASYHREIGKITPHIYDLTNHLGYADLPAIWQWWRLIQKIKPDAMFVHGNRAIALGIKAAAGRVPVIAVNHTENQKRSLPADGVITVNPHQREDLLKLGYPDPERVCVIPNMVKMADPVVLPEVKPEVPLIGLMSRLSREKGIDVFLEAMALLKERGVVVRAEIGGDGPQEAELRAQAERLGIADQITWLGWVDDVEAFYQRMHIFCFPSRFETFGIVVMEALMRALPVITTPTRGVGFLLAGQDVAQVAAIDDAQQLAEGIAAMCADWPKTIAQAQAGRALVQEKYDIQNVAKELQHFLGVVLAHSTDSKRYHA